MATVLVIDDHPDAAVSLALLLRLQGHDARIATSGVEGLEIAGRLLPTVVFLDVERQMDSCEAARRMRQMPQLDGVVLVALTGWSADQTLDDAMAAGFNHHFVKPTAPDAFQEILDRVPVTQG